MARILVRRSIAAVLTLFLVTLLVFCMISMAPGDPLGEGADAVGLYHLAPEARVSLERIYHLDQPLHRRYLLWLGDVLHGDLGRSFHDRRPVLDKIGERIGVTFSLNALSLLLMVCLAVPLGTAAAWRPGSRWDRFSAMGTYVLFAVPVFWMGLLLQILFSVKLGVLPVAGLRSVDFESLGRAARFMDRSSHLILPVLCLSYGGLAYLSRFVRATLLESTRGESVVAARARGLSSLSVMVRHGFRLAAIPMLTLAGFLIPALVGGSVIVETIFALPGLGRLFVDAAFQRDVPVIMALTLLSGAATLLGILVADLTYAAADPRIRRG